MNQADDLRTLQGRVAAAAWEHIEARRRLEDAEDRASAAHVKLNDARRALTDAVDEGVRSMMGAETAAFLRPWQPPHAMSEQRIET